MTIRIRRLPASFGISKPIARRTTIPFAGTRRSRRRASPVQWALNRSCTALSARAAANHRPVVNPSAVAQGPAPLPRRGRPAPRGGTNWCVCWAVQTRSCVKKKWLLQVERDGEPRGNPQVRRQVIDELLGAGHRRNVPVHHEAVDTSSTHKSTQSSMVCHQQAKVEFSGQGFLASTSRS